MADPFASSADPDIPTPTREDLLPHVHGSVRDQLRANTLDAKHAANEWAGARRIWNENHKQAANKRRERNESLGGSDEMWFGHFYISHLDQEDRDRIKRGDFEPREIETLAKGEDPWGDHKPLPAGLEPPETLPPFEEWVRNVIEQFSPVAEKIRQAAADAAKQSRLPPPRGERAAASARSESDSEGILTDYGHVKRIGEGFFAFVTHYRHLITNEDFAVKELKDEKYAYRFKREIRITQSLTGHPNIVELVASESSKGKYRHITRKADTNLYKYIKKYNSSLSLEKRVAIFDQVLEAIEYAHSKNILHRDIAPTNVLVFSDDHIEVCDFGMGKDLSTLSNYTTSLVARYGQVYYVAPEQRDKLMDASQRSDVYSLGKLLNFILTGRDPDVIHPCDFNSVIARATQFDPDTRYQTVSELKTAYYRLKSILSPDEKPYLPTSLGDLRNRKDKIDWQEFHLLAVRGDYDAHLYSEYVQPVIEILSHSGNLRLYYEEVADSFGDFLRRFIERLDELASMTGWPFEETKTFAKFLREIVSIVKEPESKLSSLRQIWDLAYQQDQWGAQSVMEGLLKGNYIPEEIQTQLAVHIIDSSVSRLPNSSDQAIPIKLRQALIIKAKEITR